MIRYDWFSDLKIQQKHILDKYALSGNIVTQKSIILSFIEISGYLKSFCNKL